MRAMIVDDEPLSRIALSKILSEHAGIDAFDIAGDATQALDHLSKNSYDVLLLDIQMPGLSGLELVDELHKVNAAPAVIFVTAHQEHAVAAFEKKVVDYVLKPFAAERVHTAIEAALRRTKEERAARLIEMLPHLKLAREPLARIAIKVKGRYLFFDPRELISAEANGNYVLFVQRAGSCLIREPLSTLAETLAPFGFIRIHRSILVNAAFVDSLEPCETGEYLLRMKSGKEYTVTRTYKENLKLLAKSWIGGS